MTGLRSARDGGHVTAGGVMTELEKLQMDLGLAQATLRWLMGQKKRRSRRGESHLRDCIKRIKARIAELEGA